MSSDEQSTPDQADDRDGQEIAEDRAGGTDPAQPVPRDLPEELKVDVDTDALEQWDEASKDYVDDPDAEKSRPVIAEQGGDDSPASADSPDMEDDSPAPAPG